MSVSLPSSLIPTTISISPPYPFGVTVMLYPTVSPFAEPLFTSLITLWPCGHSTASKSEASGSVWASASIFSFSFAVFIGSSVIVYTPPRTRPVMAVITKSTAPSFSILAMFLHLPEYAGLCKFVYQRYCKVHDKYRIRDSLGVASEDPDQRGKEPAPECKYHLSPFCHR